MYVEIFNKTQSVGVAITPCTWTAGTLGERTNRLVPPPGVVPDVSLSDEKLVLDK